jgi:3-oxoacyl-[acyl-carrier-protein] synthase-3
MKLVGLSGAVPRTRAPSTLAYDKFPPADVDRVVKNIGVLEHREAPLGTTASDLCIAAAEPLLDALGWSRESVDGLVFVTQSPDYFLPGTAHRIQDVLKLGGDRCFCFDVNLGCSGYSHGLVVVEGLIRAGIMKRALLLCGEVTTDTIRPAVRNLLHQHDLGNSLMFGDAGTATALEAAEVSDVKASAWGADGSGMHHISVPGGSFRCFWTPDLLAHQADEQGLPRRPVDLRINGAAVFNFTIRRVPPLADETLRRAGWQKADVDAYVFHQANKFILEFLRKKMGIPEGKVPLSIEEFGNTSSASIPLTMVTRLAEPLSAGPLKTMSLGFGAGLSWSAVAMQTDRVKVLPLVEVG